jgi:hypothetical protein
MRLFYFYDATDIIFGQGELAHRALKAFYPLTSKLDTPAQLAKHERRRRVLRRVAESGGISSSDSQSPADVSPFAPLQKHHHIATNQSNPVNIFPFLREHSGDPAVKVCMILQLEFFVHNGCQNFVPRLKDHILYRLRKLDVSHCDHSFTDEEHNSVIIPNNTIYSTQTMQVCIYVRVYLFF